MNTFFLINRVNLEIRFFSLIILIVTSDSTAISNTRMYTNIRYSFYDLSASSAKW